MPGRGMPERAQGLRQTQHSGQNIIPGCYRWPGKAGRTGIAAQRAPGNRFPGEESPAIHNIMQYYQKAPGSWERMRPAASTKNIHIAQKIHTAANCSRVQNTQAGEGRDGTRRINRSGPAVPPQPLSPRLIRLIRLNRLLGLVTASSASSALPRAASIS